MKLKSNKLMLFLVGLAMAVMPLANAQAEENINIYGWQNYSYEYVEADRTFENNRYFSGHADEREFDRIQGNAANIGFMAHMDTGIEGLQVGLRCEQFTFHNRFTSSGWCNRNSKISLRHETMGEIMFGQWLLPYNEIVAQWVDPFYDAGADSHTSIMGNVGFGGVFYNGGTFPLGTGADFSYEGLYALSFNRRQEEIVQYVWPNTSAMASQTRDGFQFRFAMTSGAYDDAHLDVRDTFLAADGDDAGDDYRNNYFGNGALDGYTDSVANGGYGLDPRIWSTGVSYQHNIGNNQIWVALAYEKHEDVTARELARPTSFPDEQYGAGVFCQDSDDEAYRIAARYKHDWGNGQSTWIAGMFENLEYDADGCGTYLGTGVAGESTLQPINTLWSDVERDSFMISGKHSFGNGFDIRFSYMNADDLECPGGVCGEPGFYSEYAGFAGTFAGDQRVNTGTNNPNGGRTHTNISGGNSPVTLNAQRNNQAEVDASRERRMANDWASTRNDNYFLDRDTDAEAYNIGLFYTMPAGTELRLTYSKVDNERNAGYDFGIGSTNLWNVTDDNEDEDVEMFAVGIVHWFD